jgi:hypothetical protein
LDDPIFKQADFIKIQNKIHQNYRSQKQSTFHNHKDVLQRFQEKEQNLIKCFKIQNENPDFNSHQPELMKRKSYPRGDSENVTALKLQKV